MRAFNVVVGIVAAVAGSVIWAISLAVYQQIMEPTGFRIYPDGSQGPKLAENGTYWPREARELGILLALVGVILIGNARRRAFVATAVLGVAWLGTDLYLDRVDIDGRPAATWLAVAGTAAVVVISLITMLVPWGRTPTPLGRHLAGGTAAVIAAIGPGLIVYSKHPKITNAIVAMDIALVVGFVIAALALLLPLTTTTFARWFVVIAAALALPALTVGIDGIRNASPVPYVGPLLLLMAIAAALGQITRILVVGLVGAGVGAVAVPGILIVLLGINWFGRVLTDLAGNPPVNAADTDVTIGLPLLIAGVAITALCRVGAPYDEGDDSDNGDGHATSSPGDRAVADASTAPGISGPPTVAWRS